MPRLKSASTPSDDESESSESEILPKKIQNSPKPSPPPRVARSGGKQPEDSLPPVSADEGEEEDGESEEEYQVEKVVGHAIDSKINIIIYEVKWKGWKETTWEPKANFGEDCIPLEKYFKRIGGEPVYDPKLKKSTVPGATKSAPTRKSSSRAQASRQSSVSSSEAETKASSSRQRGKRGRPKAEKSSEKAREGGPKKKLRRAADTTPDESTEVLYNGNHGGLNEKKKDEYFPKGDWEDQILGIQTIEMTDNVLRVHVEWKNGNRGSYTSKTVYDKAPQKMLKFYEEHLSFGPSQS